MDSNRVAKDASSPPPSNHYAVLVYTALLVVIIIDPALFWSNEIFLSLTKDNHTITWFENPWLRVYTFFRYEAWRDCSKGPPTQCIFFFIQYGVIVVVSGILLLILAIGLFCFVVRCIDESIEEDRSVLEALTLMLRNFGSRFPFKEPSIVYSFRNLIDYVIIVGVFFSDFRPSRYRLFVLTIVLSRIGQLFSLQSLRSAFHWSRTLLADALFLACIYPIPYSHVVNNNSVCFLIEASIKTPLLTKFCMYWFIRSVENLPLPNEKLERNMLLYVSEYVNLGYPMCFFEIWFGCANYKDAKIVMRNRLFLLEEVLVAISIAGLASFNSELGDGMNIFFAFLSSLCIVAYFCRGVCGTYSYKSKMFVKSLHEIDRKYVLLNNAYCAEFNVTICAILLYFNSSFNCLASIMTVCTMSVIFTRINQIFSGSRLPLLLIIFDLLAVGLLTLGILFIRPVVFPDIDLFLSGKFHSSFIFLLVVGFTSHISMGLVTLQTIAIARLVYRFTRKLSRHYCFHFENQGYLLVDEYFWKDAEKNSTISKYLCEVNGFYDERTVEAKRCSLNECVYVASLADFSIYGANIKTCVENFLKEYDSGSQLAEELRKSRLKTTNARIYEAKEAIKSHTNKLRRIVLSGARLANVDSEHWITNIKVALLLDEAQLNKHIRDYDAIHDHLRDLFELIALLEQQALTIGKDQKAKETLERIVAILNHTQSRLEEKFNAIVVPSKEALSSERSKDNGEGDAVGHVHSTLSLPIADERADMLAMQNLVDHNETEMEEAKQCSVSYDEE